MMNIGLAISGNLTGFSRFYANDEAKNLLNTTKFNFDVHNLVSFLNNGEKLYALFFSKDIIAVSLITNILDSFRRPGNLVVTVLIPRGYKIVDGLSLSRTNALYHLLNEVNDKFYERNFLNGMLNQNPAVLMQDYYSDILSQYTFVTDRMQKPVNSRIDVTSPNKRIGYVAASEGSMPQYLSSVMRKSYEGYHHVFLSPHAPQNIDEPAEEILTYRVRIENGKRVVHGEVRLSDRIPNVTPEQGYKDIPNKNFTYGQVLSGEAGMDIVASIENGDTILLTYRFHEEEKTVYFKFYDGANEVPIPLIRPILVESNGTRINIPSECMAFRGFEIYGRKTIKSGNSEYTIESGSTNVDLQRIHDGGTINVYVQHGWELRYQFNGSFTVPKRIILENKYTGERREHNNVTDLLVDTLTGRQNEWELEIYSDKFETIRVPYGQAVQPIPKRQTAPTTVNQNYERHGSVGTTNRRVQTNVSESKQGLKISSGGDTRNARDVNEIERNKKKKYLAYGLSAFVACLLIVCGVWGYKALFVKDKKDGHVPEDNRQEMEVTFSVNGYDGKAIELEKLLSELEVAMTSNVVDIDNGNDEWSKKLSYPLTDDAVLSVVISLKGHSDSIQLLSKDIPHTEFSENIPLQLSISGDELKTYVELKNMTQPTENVANQLSSLAAKGNPQQLKFAKLLSSLNKQYLDNQRKEDAENKKAAEEARKAEKAVKKEATDKLTKESEDNTIRDAFNGLALDEKTLKGMTPQNNAEKDRKNALLDVLSKLKEARTDLKIIPNIGEQNLHPDQKRVVKSLKQIYNRIKSNKNENRKKSLNSKLMSALKSCTSLNQVDGYIISKKDEYNK